MPNSKKLGNHSCLDGCLDLGADCHLNGQKNTSEKIELSFEGMTSSLITTPFAETKQEDQSTLLSPEPNVLVPSPELPIPRPADIIRHRSGGLPRSPLYISQAATPSSPEKLPQMLPESGFYTKTSASLEERIESQSYSSDEDYSEFPGLPIQSFCCHEESKLIPDSSVHDPTDLSHESFDTNLSARIGLPYSSAQISLESSRSCCQNHHQSSALQSPNPRGSSPISFNQGLNPRAAEFVSSLTNSDSLSKHPLRQSPTSPTASIPPYPFSATPRTISYNLAFPASPASLQSDSSQQSYVHPSPSPTPVRLPVYNDRLPASTQPQTPAHVPNNRLHARSSLNPFGPRMAQTAPPIRAQARSAWWRDLTMQTPTRGSRRGHLALNEEQENLEVTVEVERLLEQRRMRGNERQDLARTPE